MSVYRSYWRDDPQFDAAHRRSAMPHLPCPVLDEQTLAGLCRFAIENKFWWSRGTATRAAAGRAGSPSPAAAAESTERAAGPPGPTVGLNVAGAGGGHGNSNWNRGVPWPSSPDSIQQQTGLLHLHVDVLRSIGKGRLAASDAVACGAVVVEGNGLSQQDAVLILQQLVGSPTT